MKQLYRSNGNSSCVHGMHLPFTLSLLFFLLFTFNGHAQQIVNAYAKVTGITTVSGKSQLTITHESTANHAWAVNEEVIVIQMQDNVISGTSNTNLFGLLTGIGNAGAFETAVITALGPGVMTLNKTLIRPFNTGSNASVQVVSFTKLSTNNYPTTDDITAIPWNGSLGRGGIVAITVPGTLTLRHRITVDGLGFAGGAASANVDPNCDNSTYISNSASYGAKGEGIYLSTDANYSRGRARLLSGGGGGNSDGSGGAGGSNYSAGGNGAVDGCGDGAGLGGVGLGLYMLLGNRAFLGGGGGGGQGRGSQTAGGNGGGIIFIRAGTLATPSSNCGSAGISANGNGAGSSGTYGAGGGGAAGTVILQINSYNVTHNCDITVEADGGDGGDAGITVIRGGGGGGGGQGAVMISGSPLMNNVTQSTRPGEGGSTAWFNSDAPNGAGNNNDGVKGGIGVVLPVRLLFFTAENKNEKAVLSWSSADEANVIYSIERSTDGSDFTSIGTVTGTGQANYTFTDPNPIDGTVYYRLVVSGDLDAKMIYSSVKHVSRANTMQVATAYPNPAHDHFYIRITGNNINNKQHKVVVTSLTGQVVYTTTGIPVNNIIQVKPGTILKPGLYMFKVTSDGFEQTGKLRIQ